ncbi:MAG TPA: BON domain-containing protein [Terriglobales bacterium]|nr:BON domain-containing protein [Terriglobales bacterium]
MRNSGNSCILIVLLSLLMGFSIACSRHASDDKIAKDIEDRIATDPDTRDSQVNVSVTEGKVKLNGKVRTPVAQKKIEQIADAEQGATGVDDQTAIDPEQASAMAAAPPPRQKPKPQPIVVPSGTVLTVVTSQGLSSKTSQAGQTFLATLAQPFSVEGKLALPKGATVGGKVVSAKAKGKIKGEGELSLALTSISVADHTYPIQTSVLNSTVKGKGKRTAATTGGGAAGGALIGGIAGGGKGAGIGALIGAGAGLIGGAATGNKQIEIPAESALSFTLAESLTLPPPSE